MDEKKEAVPEVMEEISFPGTMVTYLSGGTLKARLIVIPGTGYDLIPVVGQDGKEYVALADPSEEITQNNYKDTHIEGFGPGNLLSVRHMVALTHGMLDEAHGYVEIKLPEAKE